MLKTVAASHEFKLSVAAASHATSHLLLEAFQLAPAPQMGGRGNVVLAQHGPQSQPSTLRK